MSLRRSPQLTPASLAARRANARKSTGPRSLNGKRRVAWNAMRSGRRTPVSVCCLPFGTADSDAYTALETAMREAIRPAETEPGDDAFNYCVACIWTAKRQCDRWIERLSDEEYIDLALGIRPLPRPWRYRLKRPNPPYRGWRVRVTVSLRWSRRPVRQWLEACDPEVPARDRYIDWTPRLHSLVCVMCPGHPYLKRRLNLRAKLEYY